MGEDRAVAALYRKQAADLRVQATRDTTARKRDKILRLAAEYDWRAASLEAAIALLK